MADSDKLEIDDDEFIKIFEDSDDENEFVGFGPEDLIPDYEILREIDLQQSLKDMSLIINAYSVTSGLILIFKMYDLVILFII
jgi:hypothetical protein